MKKEAKKRLLSEILIEVAPRIGAQVIMEPEWKIAGLIIFKNGKKCYFKYSSLDLNPQGSSEIAKDKDYANFFMSNLGFPTIPGKTFFSDKWCKIIHSRRNTQAALRYAKKIGFPVIVKPNSGSQGIGVFKANNEQEFLRAIKFVFEWDRVALVQYPVSGNDYRIVVVDNQLISAYQRVPLNIVGDGKSPIRDLIKQKQQQYIECGRDTKLRIMDLRISGKLKHQGLNRNSVLPKNERIFLLDNANLSSGGDSIDMTDRVHPEFRDISINLAKEMGLRLCGVDLMIDGDISQNPGHYWVLEINSSPGLDHYAKSGKEQEKIVENMYLKILQAMELDKK
ncbi:MAG: cyanophycin synthetase [bacterium]